MLSEGQSNVQTAGLDEGGSTPFNEVREMDELYSSNEVLLQSGHKQLIQQSSSMRKMHQQQKTVPSGEKNFQSGKLKTNLLQSLQVTSPSDQATDKWSNTKKK